MSARLDGFRFVPDASDGAESRMLATAANRAVLRGEIATRAGRLAVDGDEGFAIDPVGNVTWRGGLVGRLVAGDGLLAARGSTYRLAISSKARPASGCASGCRPLSDARSNADSSRTSSGCDDLRARRRRARELAFPSSLSMRTLGCLPTEAYAAEQLRARPGEPEGAWPGAGMRFRRGEPLSGTVAWRRLGALPGAAVGGAAGKGGSAVARCAGVRQGARHRSRSSGLVLRGAGAAGDRRPGAAPGSARAAGGGGA